MGPRSIAILPARLGSTRLARKVLLAETGLPLFVHTARNAARCKDLQRVVVATDSEEVLVAAREHGVEACLTRSDHQSGTDRVREALDSLGGDWDVVLNVQADEPDLSPEDLATLIGAFEDPLCEAATLSLSIEDEADWQRSSVVKIVLDQSGSALYFSRAPIPSRVHARIPAQGPFGLRHIGVYAYRPEALRRFCDLPQGRLEAMENLEQLRWLEHGHAMRVLPASWVPRGIDTPEDYADFVARHRTGSQHHDRNAT
ncbi:MAG: 3-deoxy-manno-octulosonate cytidylyltransferase [Planctomycetes bacterium]|nr:3-deoxy-manno-octulosonate cytidylyltransferase [Planctomycetota bacterium]MCB9911009.1 3-deoxy-manno-octulosonate cytidylyltransferase [Planctomycetota bacterium]HPF13394.1 3-deoxy-manno-octulosonate cytidylyltransferase [Planctomycetota bacterium]HRV81400.1 3-deoxy-manno-octulosonate cytidylyltransferase [Planctomycetota bacterium]